MPIDDTVSEAHAWEIASSSQSTYIDTYSEPPRCSGKFAEKILNRAYGGLDPDESIVSPNNSSSAGSSSSKKNKSRGMDPTESTTVKSTSSKSASSRISRSCRQASMSDQQDSAKSSNNSRSPVASNNNRSSYSRLHDSGSISGRSQMSALERRIESGRSTASSLSSNNKTTGRSKSKKSTTNHNRGTDPNGTLALIARKTSVDPPSVAGSVQFFEDSQGALVPVDYTKSSNAKFYYCDPPTSLENKGILTTCDEEDEDTTRRSSLVSGTESHYDSYNSQNSGSYTNNSDDSQSSYNEESRGTIEDADDSMMASIAENALAIRDMNDGDITVPSIPDSRALVTTSRNHTDTTNHNAIVPSQRYLASAVDNQAAMVPFDSTLFESYDHTFVICPESIRFLFLYTFLKKNADKKIIVFFSTTNSVKFHSRLLEHFHVPCLCMHSKQKKQAFINTFFRFSDLKEGILCATDAEGRDLDIPPSVDWVVQFEPPEDPTEYILRVSRISCDSDRVGRSLLFLNPGEQGFLKYYLSAAIPVSEFEIPKLAENVQGMIEHHVNSSERFLRYAEDAYGSYLIAYASHSFRDVYNVHDLNKNDVAAAFGLVKLPAIESDDETSVASGREGQRETTQSAGQAPAEGRSKTWTSNKKPKEKTWLKGEKSWPHCKIKVHPKFRDGYIPKEEEEE
jgi:ATP-dependent RNA helicase DDX18/HAS1